MQTARTVLEPARWRAASITAAGKTVALLLVVVVFALFGALVRGYAVQLADTVLYDAMLALGLNLVMGYAGQLDFGHTTFAAVGAYAAALLMIGRPDTDYVLVLLVALAVGAAVALVLAVPIFRFRGDYLALVTLGFAEIAQALATNLPWTGGANGLAGIPVAHIAGVQLLSNTSFYYLGVVLIALMAGVIYAMTRIHMGRAVLAIREDELAAATLGINPWRYKVLVFTIAGGFAGVAGAYLAGLFSFVGPDTFGLDQVILLVEIVLVGGLGSIVGSILGAAVVVTLQSVLVIYVPQIAGHEDLVIGLVLLGLILFRPQGLLGKRFVRRRT